MVWLKTAEARFVHRETTAFFGEANVLLPGHGITFPLEKSLIHRTHWKYDFCRKKTVFLFN